MVQGSGCRCRVAGSRVSGSRRACTGSAVKICPRTGPDKGELHVSSYPDLSLRFRAQGFVTGP